MDTKTSLSYDLTFEPREGYLCATIRAETVTLEAAREYLSRIAEKCIELEFEKLLIVRDIPVMLTVAALFEVAHHFMSVLPQVDAAFVNPHGPVTEEMRFAMLVGNNRGGRYEVFDNTADAEKWLLAG